MKKYILNSFIGAFLTDVSKDIPVMIEVLDESDLHKTIGLTYGKGEDVKSRTITFVVLNVRNVVVFINGVYADTYKIF